VQFLYHVMGQAPRNESVVEIGCPASIQSFSPNRTSVSRTVSFSEARPLLGQMAARVGRTMTLRPPSLPAPFVFVPRLKPVLPLTSGRRAGRLGRLVEQLKQQAAKL
jgi:hypothetical protein